MYAATDAGKSSLTSSRTGCQPGRPNRAVHAGSGALGRVAVVHVLGNLLPRRVEEREEDDAPVERGLALEQPAERLEPADGVLRRIRAVDAHDEDLGTILLDLRAASTNRLARRERVELLGVDGDRVRVRYVAPRPSRDRGGRRRMRRRRIATARCGNRRCRTSGDSRERPERSRAAAPPRRRGRPTGCGRRTRCARPGAARARATGRGRGGSRARRARRRGPDRAPRPRPRRSRGWRRRTRRARARSGRRPGRA